MGPEANADRQPDETRSIFRGEARQRYIENQQKIVLPRLVSNRLFLLLWITGFLAMILGLIITFWPLIDQLR